MRVIAGLFAMYAAAACGNTATAPSPNDTAATIDLPSTIRIGQTVPAASTVMLGRGGAQPLTSGWHSEDPSVATITDSGAVTGVNNGRTVVFVLYGGLRREREIRVVPDYEGQWSGVYRISRCTPYPNESFRSYCTGLDNAVSSVTFTLTQAGEFVTGSFTADGIAYPGFVAAITEDGLLEMTSRGVTAPGRLTTASWSLRSARRGHIDGILVWLRAGFGGANGYSVAEGTVAADAP